MKINGDPPPRPNKKGGAAGLFMFAPFTTRSEQLVPSRCKMFTVLFLMCCTKMVLLCFGNIVPQTSMLISPL